MMKKIFVFILIAFTVQAYCQNSIQSVREELSKDLRKKMKDPGWSLEETSSGITMRFIDVFFINGVLNPLNNRDGYYNRLDTIQIKIRLEDGWSAQSVDSISKRNKSILAPMINKHLAYYDSLKWKGMMSNHELFATQPVLYLRTYNIFNEEEKALYKSIVRLPDLIINDVGVFVNSDYSHYATFIEPATIEERVVNSYESFSKVLGSNSLFKAEERYY